LFLLLQCENDDDDDDIGMCVCVCVCVQNSPKLLGNQWVITLHCRRRTTTAVCQQIPLV